jgi:hypothetical protein
VAIVVVVAIGVTQAGSGGKQSPEYNGLAAYINATAPKRANDPISTDEVRDIYKDNKCTKVDDTSLLAEQLIDEQMGTVGDINQDESRIATDYFLCGEAYARDYVRKKFVGDSEERLIEFVGTLHTYSD